MWTGMMILGLGILAGVAEAAPQVQVVDKWEVRVSPGVVLVGHTHVKIKDSITLRVAPSDRVQVKNERYESLPLFDANGAPWAKGAKLRGLTTFETTAPDMLVPESVHVKSAPNAAPLKLGVDYALEPRWATFGRLPEGALKANPPVWVDYEYGRGRIDSIVVDRYGDVSLVQGAPHNATPLPPQPGQEATTLANIWVPGRLSALTDANLYPILEQHYPEPVHAGHPPAATLLPKTWAKLKNGEQLHILAWGDSVTDGGQASDEMHRYQCRFATLLHQRFPDAMTELSTVAWGGRDSDSFLKEPPGSPHNFEEAVLAPHPDLILMEFVNDAYLTPAQVEERYSALLRRFREIGAEWIILTPHYVRPDWMGASSVRVESDPRPYVAGIRQFAEKHHVAVADASLRWGHLLAEGIPYTTLLSNSINHPDDRGHEIFAQALMELFGGPVKTTHVERGTSALHE
ncbi:MAG TPA: GDSL-type esterase/lipase family protein [Chthonomonadaceae bacterium]|nr:GDSL-type esterase/lipase family protein [Chthonomonadaceae bacterium]